MGCEQSIGFLLDHRVAFAGQTLEMRSIEHGDLAARISNHALLLQLSGRFRNTFASNSEHVGDEFLCHVQSIRAQPVEREQEPAAQLLIE